MNKENEKGVTGSYSQSGDATGSEGPHAEIAPSGKESQPQASVLAAILSEVQKTNKRIEIFEKRLEKLEGDVQTPVSSSSSGQRYKMTVPTRVRVSSIILLLLNAYRTHE